MAKADWCTVSPMSGNGDGEITISAPAHTGRTERSTTVTVQNQNGNKPSATIEVNQASPGVILTMEPSKPDVPKEGGTVIITGTSNLPYLHCEVGVWDADKGIFLMGLVAPDLITRDIQINGQMIDDYAFDIPQDQGASNAYEIKITLTIPASPFATDIPVGVRVSDKPKAGASTINYRGMCLFTWKAGASSMSVDKTSIPIVNTGGTDTVNIISNDDWTIS